MRWVQVTPGVTLKSYIFFLSLCQEDHNDNDQFIILSVTMKAKKITSLT